MKRAFQCFTVVGLLLAVLSGCKNGSNGPDGKAGPQGPAGPSMPVIQSLSAAGVPAKPGGSVTATVAAQSAEGLTLTYAWTVSGGWTVTSGGGTDTAVISAPGAYGASGSATVTVSDTKGKSAAGTITLSTEGNGSPIIHTIDATPSPVYKNHTMNVTASAADPNGDAMTYSWSVPEGYTIVSGQGTPQISVLSTLFTSGDVQLSVGDGSGGAATGSIFVSTYDGAWGLPELMERDNAHDAESPRLAVDPEGNAIAVWQQSDGSVDHIQARLFTPGTGWDTVVSIETSTYESYYPEIAIDPQGNAVAVWLQNDAIRPHVWANRYEPGSGWSAAQPVENLNIGGPGGLSIGMDSSGNAIVVWHQSDGKLLRIYATRYDAAGQAWGAPKIISSFSVGSAQSPHVAVDPDGNAIAVWQEGDGTRDNIWANRYVAGPGWGTAELIETNNAGTARFPRVAVDSNGNAIAVWTQFDGTKYYAWANRYAGSGWGVPVMIENGSGNSTDAAIAMNPAGVAVAVWSQWENGIYNIWSNRFAPGSGWGAAELIETVNAGDASWPQAALDSAGNAIATWSQFDGIISDVIWANRYRSGIGWGRAELIGNSTGLAGGCIAMDPDGDALAVWSKTDDGIRSDIWANRFE